MATFNYSRHRTRGENYVLKSITMRGTQFPLTPLTRVETRCYFHEFEEMWDNQGPRTEFHAIKHYKTTFLMRPITDTTMLPPQQYQYWSCSPFWVPRGSYLLTGTNVRTWLNSANYDIGSTRWADFTTNAFDSLTQQIPDVIDVPNILRDIFTMKGLARQCCNILRRIWDILKSASGLLRGGLRSSSTLRSVMKDLADSFLINEFGIKPLIREVESLMGGTVAILKRLDFLRRTQGSVFTANYTESVPFTKADKNLGVADAYMYGSNYLWLRGIQGTVRYTCSARIKNELIGLDSMLAEVKAYLAALGGSKIASFIWDLVPFSFVVDWNYSVSKWLDRYASIRPFQGELKILSAGCSFKKVCSGELVIEGPSTPGSESYGFVRMSEYIRQPGLDRGLNMFRPFSALTPKQLGILSALVIQRATG